MGLFSHLQVSGRLKTAVPDAAHAAGQFTIHWDADKRRVHITHADNPEKLVWGTVPGRAFVGAASGRERVSESRGHFFIRERRRAIYAIQSIESIEPVSNGIRITGRLRRLLSRRAVPYMLTFTAVRPDQLAFCLRVDYPAVNRVFLTYGSSPDEHFFGFGEQFSYVDMKGRRLPIFIMEQGVGRGDQPITFFANLTAKSGGSWHSTYAGIPHYLTNRLRSLYLDTCEYCVFDLRRADRVQIELFAAEMTGRILSGDSPAALIRSYTGATGQMKPLPGWITDGAVVGMQGGAERVRQVYGQLKETDCPVAAFWLQDWAGQRVTSFGRQLWWNWELDDQRYPGWAELVADLAQDGVKVMTYINPFVVDANQKPRYRRNLFREAAERGYLVKHADGSPYLVEGAAFSAGMVDLTNPGAWDWYKAVLIEEVAGAGAMGWMADYAETLPYDAVLYSGEPAARMHNRYPELWAQLNREVIDALGDDRVAFHRAGYRESARHATLFWVGDQLVDWGRHDGIKSVVTGLLSSGLSGWAYNHSDIGGFTTVSSFVRNYQRSEELLLRWMELAAFTPVYRTHEGNRPDLNAQVYSNERTLAHFTRFAKVHQAWGFYRSDLIQEAAKTGLPVVRHPFIHYPDDPRVYRLSYQQFMLGSELMVVPVLDKGAASARGYLPAGEWVHLWSGLRYGERTSGQAVVVPAPIGQPGIFYRAGSSVGEQFAASLREMGLLSVS